MSAMEQTRYRESLGTNALTGRNALVFDERRRDPQPALSTAPSADDPIPLFLSELRDEPDPRELAPSAARQRTRQQTSRRTSILTRIAAGGMVVSAFAITVAAFNSDFARALIDKATASVGATRDQSAVQAASNQPAARQLAVKDDPARAPDPVQASGNTTATPSGTEAREPMASDDRAALQSQAPTASTGNEVAAPPSKTFDAETLAALMTRARSLLALGDIAAARLLLERAASARDANAAFLLARTYDPAVVGGRDTRSITPDAAMARDWYSKAAGFGSKDAQQRLTQFQN